MKISFSLVTEFFLAYSNWDGVAGGDPLIEQALLLSTQQYIDDFKHRDQPGSSQQ